MPQWPVYTTYPATKASSSPSLVLIFIHASDWEQRGSALVLASRHSPDQHPLCHDGRRKQAHAIYGIPRSKGQQQPEYGGLGRRAQEERLPIGHVAQQVLRNGTKVSFRR